MEDKVLTFEEALARTPYKETYFRKLMSLGKIPYYRPRNGKTLFLESEIRAFLLRNRHRADYELAADANSILLKATKGRASDRTKSNRRGSK
jgi:hypothetical protein